MRAATLPLVALLLGGCYDFDSLANLYQPGDGGADLAVQDLHVPVDGPRDLEPPPPDLKPPRDLEGADLSATPPDLKPPPDLQGTADMTPPPMCGDLGAPTWTRLQAPTSYRLESVYAATATDVWAIGSAYEIYHYDGQAWTKLPYPKVSPAVKYPIPKHIAGTGPNDVYLVTDSGSTGPSAILHTTDHGAHWSEVDVPTQGLRSIWGDAPGNVYAVGTGYVGHSAGGDVWQAVTPSGVASYGFTDVWGVGARVWGVGGPTVFDTATAGAQWQAQDPPATPNKDWGQAIWGLSTSDVFLVGEEGWMWRYHSFGWDPPTQVRALPNMGAVRGLHGVWGTGPTDLYLVGDAGTLLHSTDDGDHWTQEATGVCADDANGPSLRAVHGAGGVVFVVGEGGLVLRKP